MRHLAPILLLLAALALGGAPAALADPLPELDLPEPLEEILGDQDHVVGEELC